MKTFVRRGGRNTPGGFLFELSGGNVALDFVNTVDLRPTDRAKELIPTFPDFCSWAEQSGILTPEQSRSLLKKSKQETARAEKLRKKAIVLRESLYRIFRNVVDGLEVPEQLLKEWNLYVHQSMKHYRLVRGKENFIWQLYTAKLDFDSILWPIIHTAVDLLTGSTATRIRRCAADQCDWLFLDTSKRGNRRWCDMSVCGNRAKAQRFYRKRKQT